MKKSCLCDLLEVAPQDCETPRVTFPPCVLFFRAVLCCAKPPVGDFLTSSFGGFRMDLHDALSQVDHIQKQLAHSATFRGYRAAPAAFCYNRRAWQPTSRAASC